MIYILHLLFIAVISCVENYLEAFKYLYMTMQIYVHYIKHFEISLTLQQDMTMQMCMKCKHMSW